MKMSFGKKEKTSKWMVNKKMMKRKKGMKTTLQPLLKLKSLTSSQRNLNRSQCSMIRSEELEDQWIKKWTKLLLKILTIISKM